MGLDLYAFEMLTGRRLVPLPIATGDWAIGVNADDSITCSVPARAAVTETLDVWGSTTLARNGLLAVVDNEPVAAGPIWKRSYKQGGMIDLTAGGLRSYWSRRVLLPVDARGNPLVDPVTGDPVTAYDTNLSGLSLGTIAKRYVELARLWPGGEIPMILPDDEAGSAERNVAAIELKKIRVLLDNLSDVEGGPEIAFRVRWAEDGLGIYWEMQTGTTATPRLGNPDPDLVQWTIGAKSGAFGLEIEEDGTGMAEEVFAGGGRSGDRAIIAQGRDTTLYDAGFPLLQDVDTSHSDVVLDETMQSYADRGAALGKFSASSWKMKVRARELGSPRLGDYWAGDMATLVVDEAEPVLPAGPVVRRIASIGGNAKNEAFDLVFAEGLA